MAEAEKYVVLGLERDPDVDYYVKTSGHHGKNGGDVWAVARVEPGDAKPEPRQVTTLGFHVDWNAFDYFVDADGDVARRPRVFKRKL